MICISDFWKITTLALVDSINPCAIAVLAMVLMTILIQNPEQRKKVLYTGLAFVTSIYMGYLFYGVIIIQIFKTFNELMLNYSHVFYKGLAILAMVLGALNVKDYFMYKPGGLVTEMPIFMRPKVKNIINKITSPKGAFVIGFLVTIFLLPCTIGPYVIASGILCNGGILESFVWLLYYNIIFILPMLFIVGLVYYGFAKVDEVSGWKERNIRVLHLVAGVLLFWVGVALLVGWL